MKLKIYTLILALGAAWSLQSCDNNDDDSIAVPAELQNAFSSKYPNAANVKWESKSGYYVADFYDTRYLGQVDDDDAEYVEEATGDTYYLIDIENSEKDVKISADGQILG